MRKVERIFVLLFLDNLRRRQLRHRLRFHHEVGEGVEGRASSAATAAAAGTATPTTSGVGAGGGAQGAAG